MVVDSHSSLLAPQLLREDHLEHCCLATSDQRRATVGFAKKMSYAVHPSAPLIDRWHPVSARLL